MHGGLDRSASRPITLGKEADILWEDELLPDSIGLLLGLPPCRPGTSFVSLDMSSALRGCFPSAAQHHHFSHSSAGPPYIRYESCVAPSIGGIFCDAGGGFE